MRHAYLGPEYAHDEIKAFLDGQGIAYQELSDAEVVTTVGRLLAENNVIGWYRGRMEFGPRALGARSILANASHPQMKDILNDKIKHREQFRPFAPAVLLEETPNYFALGAEHESPYMLLVADVHPQYRRLLPAITHVDGSARLQTVDRELNPRYYRLIEAFGQLTGIPVVLNTSFNLKGEPIVASPADALSTFSRSGMDLLVLNDWIVQKA